MVEIIRIEYRKRGIGCLGIEEGDRLLLEVYTDDYKRIVFDLFSSTGNRDYFLQDNNYISKFGQGTAKDKDIMAIYKRMKKYMISLYCYFKNFEGDQEQQEKELNHLNTWGKHNRIYLKNFNYSKYSGLYYSICKINNFVFDNMQLLKDKEEILF